MAVVGIGCGGLLVLALVAAAFVGMKAVDAVKEFAEDPTLGVAGLIVQGHPDLELVSTDAGSGTIEVKVSSSGETLVIDRSQIESGKFSFTKIGDDGEEEVVELDFAGAGEGKISITGSDGETVFETLPGEGVPIPAWVPAYPGEAARKNTFSMKVGDSQNGSFSLAVAETPQGVIDAYRPALESSGFVVTTQGLATDGKAAQTVLSARDDANRQSINLVIIPTESGSTLQVTYSDRE